MIKRQSDWWKLFQLPKNYMQRHGQVDVYNTLRIAERLSSNSLRHNRHGKTALADWKRKNTPLDSDDITMKRVGSSCEAKSEFIKLQLIAIAWCSYAPADAAFLSPFRANLRDHFSISIVTIHFNATSFWLVFFCNNLMRRCIGTCTCWLWRNATVRLDGLQIWRWLRSRCRLSLVEVSHEHACNLFANFLIVHLLKLISISLEIVEPWNKAKRVILIEFIDRPTMCESHWINLWSPRKTRSRSRAQWSALNPISFAN